MTSSFLRAYSQLVIRTCHRRNVHAMGGMAAQIPIKHDPVANDAAMAKVQADKEREAGDGHDGTWVAHPGLVPIAKAVFDRIMPGPNQIERKRDDVVVSASDLLRIPEGTKTEAGLRQNIAVGIGYIEAWLRGIGCVPLFNLMEDAATAEISRAQIWQWRRHGARLDDGRKVESVLIRTVLDDEMAKLRRGLDDEAWARSRYEDAANLFLDLVESDDFEEFLTLPAYRMVAEAT
jgi:malate synthase